MPCERVARSEEVLDANPDAPELDENETGDESGWE